MQDIDEQAELLRAEQFKYQRKYLMMLNELESLRYSPDDWAGRISELEKVAVPPIVRDLARESHTLTALTN